MILSTEYILAIAFAIILLFAVGAYLVNTSVQQARAPKVDLVVEKAIVIRKTSGLYFEFVIQSKSTAKVCINFIDIIDVSTGNNITIGDGDAGEASDLPVCLDPSVTYTLGGYQGLDNNWFMPGTKIAVVFYYSIGVPSNNHDVNNPLKIYTFTKVTGT